MKVSILSESDADEAGIKILAEAICAAPLETVRPRVEIRGRGWSGVIKHLPMFYKAMHWRADADGLIVVIDSDSTPAHDIGHEESGFTHPGCRYCELRRLVDQLQQHVTPRPQAPLKIAMGLAVPAIESWYQCGLDVHCTEARFRRESSHALYELRRELKRNSYGFVDPPQALMTQKAIEHATRLAQLIPLLERNFPIGFGLLARSLRNW